jgi:hypothetical protein
VCSTAVRKATSPRDEHPEFKVPGRPNCGLLGNVEARQRKYRVTQNCEDGSLPATFKMEQSRIRFFSHLAPLHSAFQSGECPLFNGGCFELLRAISLFLSLNKFPSFQTYTSSPESLIRIKYCSGLIIGPPGSICRSHEGDFILALLDYPTHFGIPNNMSP